MSNNLNSETCWSLASPLLPPISSPAPHFFPRGISTRQEWGLLNPRPQIRQALNSGACWGGLITNHISSIVSNWTTTRTTEWTERSTWGDWGVILTKSLPVVSNNIHQCDLIMIKRYVSYSSRVVVTPSPVIETWVNFLDSGCRSLPQMSD